MAAAAEISGDRKCVWRWYVGFAFVVLVTVVLLVGVWTLYFFRAEAQRKCESKKPKLTNHGESFVAIWRSRLYSSSRSRYLGRLRHSYSALQSCCSCRIKMCFISLLKRYLSNVQPDAMATNAVTTISDLIVKFRFISASEIDVSRLIASWPIREHREARKTKKTDG